MHSVLLLSAPEQNSPPWWSDVGDTGRCIPVGGAAPHCLHHPPRPMVAGHPSSLMSAAPALTVAGHGGQCERFVGVHDPLDCPQARTLPPCHHVWSLRSRSLGRSPHGQGWLSLWPELVKHVCFLRGSLRLWAGDVLGPDYILNVRFSSKDSDSSVLSLSLGPTCQFSLILNAELCTRASHLLERTGQPVSVRVQPVRQEGPGPTPTPVHPSPCGSLAGSQALSTPGSPRFAEGFQQCPPERPGPCQDTHTHT